MRKLYRVLAATDLSAPARHAAERAALVARETGATLDLVHVASLAPLERLRRLVAAIPPELEERVVDAAQQEMRELAATLLDRHGVAAGVNVRSGSLLAELAMQSDDISADLVVLGARGANFMRHLLLGSTAERMVGRAVRPMLVVKQAARERYRTVLVPVDFSRSSLPALENARAVAPNAEIVLLHAFSAPFEGRLRHAGVDDDAIRRFRVAAREDALEKARALRDEAGLAPDESRLLVLHGHAASQIIEQEQVQYCDLIVMGKRGESAVEDFLLGSVTRHVLSESQCDVLVSV
jgi:nucleotide-binding universal stress UspA family protein